MSKTTGEPQESTTGHSKWGISVAIILGSMTTSIMGGTINVALPTMMTFLRAEVSQIQNDSYIQSLLVLAGISLVVFVVAELTCAIPLVNLKLYTNVEFTLASVVTFFNAFTNFGMNVLMSIFLQRGLGFTPQQAGAIRLPSAVMRGSTSLFSGSLADKMEARWLILSGALVLVLVFMLFATINVWTGIIETRL